MGGQDVLEPDFRGFSEGSHDFLCTASMDGRFQWMNATWTRLGWSLDELRARPFIDFVHPADVEPTLREISRLDGGARTIRFTNRYRTKDGGYRWLEWNSWPSGGVIYAIARDITNERDALATAQRQVETLELAEQLGNFGHWRVDGPTHEVTWSPNVYRIHGEDPQTFTPTLASGIEAYHPDDRDRVQRYVQSSIERGESWEFRLRLMRRDGAERIVRSIGRVEKDPVSGDVRSMFGVFQDVTEQERTQMARNAELEQFAYAAAHDLQAPLRTMLGFLDLLEEELGDVASEEVRDYLRRLTRSASRMRLLVSELYRYAKAVGSNAATEPVELTALVESVAQERSADLDDAGASLEVGELPTLHGATGPLGSVFANLIDNAIKYRSPDRPLHITVRSRAEGRWVRIEFEDNGKGFEPAHAERIFGLFKQLEPNTSAGIGVGLALCKKIVERHGGTITARSKPSGGATFVLRFQAANVERAPSRPQASSASESSLSSAS